MTDREPHDPNRKECPYNSPARPPGAFFTPRQFECNCKPVKYSEPHDGPSAEDMAEIYAAIERAKFPPCLDCGAMTEEEAESKCNCGGDKDHCHGCDLWG